MPYGLPGSLVLPNSPVRLSGTPATVGRTMPEHGGDTDEVLRSWLGLDASAIGALRARGVVK
jgi:crotonobetainyl-CoA:carnitine CoA-transferase CaiB-like acyl-CoA transferase